MQLFNRFRPKIIISLAGVGLVALAIVILSLSPTPAQPVISWVPELVNEVVLAGETKTVSVSFIASEDLGAVDVTVMPELEPFVRTEPMSFESITKKQTVNLDIIISAPADATPQVVEGTVQIRNAGQTSQNFAQLLPATVAISEGDDGLPPDPGDEGKKTLEGIDSDGDGVRDDIQRHIAITYPDSARTRAALTQNAKAIQNALLEAEDEQASIVLGHERMRAVNCLIHTLGAETTLSVFDEFRAQMLNTDERSRAYIKADAHRSGQSFPRVQDSEKSAFCDFNSDALEN
jgi:hypothetical protein